MKRIPFFFVLFFFCYCPVKAQHDNMNNTAQEHVMLNKASLKWGDGPPTLPKGAKMTVIDGDPSKEGMFTVRLIFPANYKIKPHTHPTAEHVTVLEGNFYMGSGEKFDEKKAMMLTPGGYATMPAEYAHYAFTKGKCVVQVHAMGPFTIKYINPADDPSTKKP